MVDYGWNLLIYLINNDWVLGVFLGFWDKLENKIDRNFCVYVVFILTVGDRYLIVNIINCIKLEDEKYYKEKKCIS